MTKIDHQTALEKFDDYIRLRQSLPKHDADRDIRNWVLENRYAQWGIGYIEANLRSRYASEMPRLFPNAVSFEDASFGRSGMYLVSGHVDRNAKVSHPGAVRSFMSLEFGDNLLFFEQSFIATSHSWSEALKKDGPRRPCLGFVYDDIAHYYMTDYPNRLNNRLNSADEPGEEELERARRAIARIVTEKISKYNSQPIYRPTFSYKYTRRVLVCDQAFADASTVFGRLTERSFEKMLLAAIRENPDAQIIVKTHPDTFWEKGKRVGYYNHLVSAGRILILREPINPYSLFECVDTVYVGSSQMGLEALFAGKKVVVFGAPFYAGWGLTDDRQAIPHRHRKRSLEDIFYYFYIWYTIYHVPDHPVPSQLEDVLDHVVANRPHREIPEFTEPLEAPVVSVILPVYGVEKHIDECLHSIRRQSLRNIEIITINDASPDRSQEIIDRHAAGDARIRPIVLAENVGQGFARNRGIDLARGTYIQFLDSDDYLASEYHLENVVAAAISDEADMVRGRKAFEQVENAAGKVTGKRSDWCEVYFEDPFHGATLASHPEVIKGRHFWNWLYRRDFLNDNDIRFLTTQWEEKPFLLKALMRARSISSIDSAGFVYRVRTDSTTRRPKTLADCENQVSNYESLVEMLEAENAFTPESPLHSVAVHLVGQFLHYMIFGFVRDTTLANGGEKAEAELFDRLSALLRRTNIDPSDFSYEVKVFSLPHIASNAYPLIYAGLVAGKYDLVRTAIARDQVEQEKLIAELLEVPADRRHHDLQVALGMYARNTQVKTAEIPSDPSKPATKKPRLLIHIGSTKTGSTFIQHYLEHNRAELLRRGVYVPERGLFWQPTRPHKQAGHAHLVPLAKQRKDSVKKHVDATIELLGGRVHTVILTSEAYFLNQNSIEIARQFADYDVRMVCYLRRQDDWANSQYGEFVAGGAVGRVDVPISAWLNQDVTENRMNYLSTIQLWASVIGKENLLIGIYEKGRRAASDIVGDFLDLTGLTDCAGLPTPKSVFENRFPFGNEHVSLIQRLNRRHWPDRDRYFDFIEEAGRRVTEIRRAKGKRPPVLDLLSRDEREAILEKYAAGNRIIAKDFLGIESGELFSSEIRERDPHVAEGVDVDEFDAIMQAFDRWGRQPKKKVPAKPAPGKKPVKRAPPKVREESGQIDVRKALLYKTFLGFARLKLNPSKLAKLERDPDRFFYDSKNGLIRLVGRLIGWERRIRGTSHV